MQKIYIILILVCGLANMPYFSTESSQRLALSFSFAPGQEDLMEGTNPFETFLKGESDPALRPSMMFHTTFSMLNLQNIEKMKRIHDCLEKGGFTLVHQFITVPSEAYMLTMLLLYFKDNVPETLIQSLQTSTAQNIRTFHDQYKIKYQDSDKCKCFVYPGMLGMLDYASLRQGATLFDRYFLEGKRDKNLILANLIGELLVWLHINLTLFQSNKKLGLADWIELVSTRANEYYSSFPPSLFTDILYLAVNYIEDIQSFDAELARSLWNAQNVIKHLKDYDWPGTQSEQYKTRLLLPHILRGKKLAMEMYKITKDIFANPGFCSIISSDEYVGNSISNSQIELIIPFLSLQHKNKVSQG